MFLQAIALLLMTLGGFIAAMNWLSLFQTWYTGRFCSPGPLLGAGFLSAGMLLFPATRPYAWTAVLLDYGTLAFLLAIPYIVYAEWSTSRWNLLEEYAGQLGNKTVHLRLFRKGSFILKQRLQRGRAETGITELSLVGEWQREGERLLLRLNEGAAVFESSSGMASDALRSTQSFPSHEGTEFSLAGIELRRTYK